ncbi:hypothetical protein SLE2022_170680 [Rubroshorea leprosula]
MKRVMPWSDKVDLISSDESSSEAEVDDNDGTSNSPTEQPPQELSPQGMLMKRAELYQEYMKEVPIPAQWGAVIPFTSWMGLGRSIKQLYGQPLHYLANVLLKQWDQLRFGSEDEDTPLDIIFHPCKAEATIWLIEEAHQRITASHRIAKLWQSDPMHDAFVDPIFPELLWFMGSLLTLVVILCNVSYNSIKP